MVSGLPTASGQLSPEGRRLGRRREEGLEGREEMREEGGDPRGLGNSSGSHRQGGGRGGEQGYQGPKRSWCSFCSACFLARKRAQSVII